MAYMDAMKKIEDYAKEQEMYQKHIQDNKVLNKLDQPGAKLGTAFGTAGARMISAAGIKADPGSLMAAASPAAAALMMGLLPLRAGTQLNENKKRMTEIQSQQAIYKDAPGSIRGGDILQSASLGQKGFSKSMMNLYLGMMAADALMPGSGSTMKNLSLGVYGASGLTGGPLRAAMTVGGFGQYLAGSAANPITAGLSSLTSMVGGGTASALTGAGGLATSAGAGGLGSVLGGAGKGLGGLMAGMGPGAMMMTAIPLMMALNPVINKAMTAMKGTGEGPSLLKTGKVMRPIVTSSNELQKRYSTTLFLDKQVDATAQQGGIKFEWWALLKYMSAISDNTAQLGYMAEYFQGQDNNNQVSANLTQNALQAHFRHTGSSSGDLTNPFVTPEEEFQTMLDTMSAPGALLARGKRSLMGAAIKMAETMEIAGSFLNPMDYIAGGENNPLRKLQKLRSGNDLQDTINAVSKSTGIPTTFIQAMETSATTLADMGETAQDKTVSLLGGIHELNRFSAFRLQDISKALGVDEEQSFMGKISQIMGEAQDATDQKKGIGRRVLDWAGGSRIGALAGGAAGAALLGPVGAFAAMLPAMMSGGLDFADKKMGRSKNFGQALSSIDIPGIFGGGIDARQAALGQAHDAQMQKQAQADFYMNIEKMTKALTDTEEGIHISFSTKGNTKISEITGLLDGIEENTDWLEEELILLNRCCGFGTGFKGQRRNGAGKDSRGRRRNRSGGRGGVVATDEGSGKGTPSKSTGKGKPNAVSKGAKGAKGLGGAKWLARGAGVLGVVGGAMTINDMMNDDSVGNSDLGTAAGYAFEGAVSGAATGAMLGSFVPIIGTTIGAVAGGILGGAAAGSVSLFGDKMSNWFKTEDEIREEKIKDYQNANSPYKLSDRMTEEHIKKAERDMKKSHPELFGLISDDGEVSYDQMTGRTVFNDTKNNRLIDTKTGKVLLDRSTAGWTVEKGGTRTAEDFLATMKKNIAENAGNENGVIDTKEEISMLLAALSSNTNQASKLSSEQQSSMIELLSGLIKTHAVGNTKLIQSVEVLGQTMKERGPLNPHVKRER